MTEYCPACERGTLVAAVDDEHFAFDGEQLVANGIEFSRCTNCGEDVVLEDQARRNVLRFADAKHRHLRTLTTGEIVRARETFSVTQAEAALMFGGGQNAFSKYERGEVLHSRAMDLLLRVALEVDGAREFLAGRAGLKLQVKWTDVQTGTISDDDSIVSLSAHRARYARRNAAACYINEGISSVGANDGQWRDEPGLSCVNG